MKPSVGRIVHYVAFGTPKGEYQPGACRPAIITEVIDRESGDVKATIFQTEGTFTKQCLHHDEAKAPGTWHWPEREE
jgi:hypothetical protein